MLCFALLVLSLKGQIYFFLFSLNMRSELELEPEPLLFSRLRQKRAARGDISTKEPFFTLLVFNSVDIIIKFSEQINKGTCYRLRTTFFETSYLNIYLSGG